MSMQCFSKSVFKKYESNLVSASISKLMFVVVFLFLFQSITYGVVEVDPEMPDRTHGFNCISSLWNGEPVFWSLTDPGLQSTLTVTVCECEGTTGETGKAIAFIRDSTACGEPDCEEGDDCIPESFEGDNGFIFAKISGGSQKDFEELLGYVEFSTPHYLTEDPTRVTKVNEWFPVSSFADPCDFTPSTASLFVSCTPFNKVGRDTGATFTIELEWWNYKGSISSCSLPYGYWKGPVMSVAGSIEVKINKPEDFSIDWESGSSDSNFTSPVFSGSGVAYIKKIRRIYEDPAASSRHDGSPCPDLTGESKQMDWWWDYSKCISGCSSDDPVCEPDEFNYNPSGGCYQDFYRVKVPGWSLEALGTPDYMNGWSYVIDDDETSGQIKFSLGDLGSVVFNCSVQSASSGPEIKSYVSEVRYCTDGQSYGNGQSLWKFDYDTTGDEPVLEYIYSVDGNDPNLVTNPTACNKYYQYDWDGSDLTVNYYNTQIDAVNPQRQWGAEFDAQGNVVKYTSGSCTSGCGGGVSGLEHVEFFTESGLEDIIKKRFNAAGDVIEENQYSIETLRSYKSDVEVGIINHGFESESVADGDSDDINYGWSSDSTPTPQVWDHNTAQWTARYPSDPNFPGSEQVLTLDGGAEVIQKPSRTISAYNVYMLSADVGAYAGGTSSAVIKLMAVDFSDPNNPTTLLEIDVDETGVNSEQGDTLVNGQWVTEGGIWECDGGSEYIGQRLKIYISGDDIDVDNVQLSAHLFTDIDTRPLLTSRWADPLEAGKPNVKFVDWQYDLETSSAVEKRYVFNDDLSQNDKYRVTKYQYADSTFSEVISTTEYEQLNDDPSCPAGNTYTTQYSFDDDTATTLYPSGKKISVSEYEDGVVVRSYTQNVEQTAQIINDTHYRYNDEGNLIWQRDSRGGEAEYTYEDGLLVSQEDPNLIDGENWVSQETRYVYDDSERMLETWHKHLNPSDQYVWIKTHYYYGTTFGTGSGYDKVVVDESYSSHPAYGTRTGINQTTEYKYNDFGQAVLTKGPNGVVTGNTYGLGGELVSQFVLSTPSDFANYPFDVTLKTLISQTYNYYNSDGKIEYVLKAKSDDTFTYDDPGSDPENPTGSVNWVVTKYVYDFLGRRIEVIQDLTGLAFKTTYEYDNQGQVERTIQPNDKWTKTEKDGRGLSAKQTVGYDELQEQTVVSVSVNWTESKYDSNGNLKERATKDGVKTIYEYDNFDRLKRVKKGIR